MDRVGVPYRRLTRADIDAEYPWVLTHPGDWGFHLESGGVLFARRILEALVGLLDARGATLRRATVVAIEGSDAVLEGGERVRGDVVVVAAGPWVDRLLPDLAERVRPSRQVVAHLTPPSALAATWATAPMLLDVGTAGFYAVPPVAGTPLKIGDHRFSLTGDPDGDREPTRDELLAVAGLARDRLRGYDQYALSGGRACFYTVQADEEFIVERRGGVVVATGFSGHGFKFGPLVGRRIADCIEGTLDGDALTRWAAGRSRAGGR
jgi:glycine/D-amino acid oxidase-like deaminating enzyme